MLEYDLVIKIRNFFGLLVLFSLAVLLVFPKLNIQIGVIYSIFLLVSVPIFFILFLIIHFWIMAFNAGGIVQLVYQHINVLLLINIICILSLISSSLLKLDGYLAILFIVIPGLILFAISPMVFLSRRLIHLDALILKISSNKKKRAK